MNLEFLGDALDHWKGSLFQSLCAGQVLHDFAVNPMATDQESWKEADFEVHARLIEGHGNWFTKSCSLEEPKPCDASVS